MAVQFLTPVGALLALGVLVPLAALVAISRRANRVRAAVGIDHTPRRLLAPALAVAAVGGLLGLAATQPVVDRTATREVRSDAEVFIVLDISRSMLAQLQPGSPTRLARAKAAADELRAGLPGVPVGIASLTDRVLPHLFPSPDEAVFRATLERAIDIERPPPRSGYAVNATNFDSLTEVAVRNFFPPSAKRRLLIVLSDGESEPLTLSRIGRLLGRRPRIRAVFVHFWDAGERVYSEGVPEPQYTPDPSSRILLEGLAAATGGSVHGEDDLEGAADRSRALIGDGPTLARGERRDRHALSPYLALAAFLPLAFLVARPDR
jgi:hypothetical protein